ncbi:hypothetical protein ACIPIC_05115 [Streptomyces collinus]|uniref:hypothetical protein n=1 Tax=Streptomyces collinus TaxID=42684 RepID=UPI00382FD89B
MRAGWIRLWRWTAWGGIGLSLYAGWLTVDDVRDRASSEREIDAACDRLISPAAVMDLRDGMVRATTSEYNRFDAGQLPGSCTVYKVPEPGKSQALFTLVVQGISASRPLNRIGDDSRLEPFDTSGGAGSRKQDVTAVADRRPEPQPLAGGLGWHGNRYTTVRAECGPGSEPAAPTLLHVTARADYEDVSAADRQRLARIARSAADVLTLRIGCRTRLPELHDNELPLAPTALRPAQSVSGSCRWFAEYTGRHAQGRLPDRALAVPTRQQNPAESCLLAVSPKRVRHIAEDVPEKDRDFARAALTHSPWWLRTVTYLGTEARTVGYDSVGSEDKIIKLGTAGHSSGAWWVSSLCDGKPALHTLSSGYTYDNILGADVLSALFRAYVNDFTKQHGCTHVKYPEAKDFRSP